MTNFKLDLSLVPWSIIEMFQFPGDQLMVFVSRRRLSHGSPSTFVMRWTSVTSSCDSLDHPGLLAPGTPTDIKGTLCVDCSESPSVPTFSTSFLLVSTPPLSGRRLRRLVLQHLRSPGQGSIAIIPSWPPCSTNTLSLCQPATPSHQALYHHLQSVTFLLSVPIHSNSIHTIQANECEEELSNLRINQSSGPDAIPASVLKLSAATIARPVCSIFNASLATSVFPSLWKHAHVKPLHKGGDKLSLSNYRPISLLPILSKALERVVPKQLVQHLTDNHLLHHLQSGFRSGHSTSTSLLRLYKRLVCSSGLWSSGWRPFPRCVKGI